MESFLQAAKFAQKNPVVAEKVYAITDSARTMAAVAANTALFIAYYQSSCSKHCSVLEAASVLKNDSIIVFFADINLYGVFSNTAYAEVLAAIKSSGIIQPRLYEIVNTQALQKLAFICSEPDYYARVLSYTADYFNTVAYNNDGHITVNLVCKGLAANTKYNELYSYIHGVDSACAQTLCAVRVRQICDYQYRHFTLSDSADYAYLRVKQPINSMCFAKTWVAQNNPHHYETTISYYDKYVEAHYNVVSMTTFETIVMETVAVKPMWTGMNQKWVYCPGTRQAMDYLTKHTIKFIPDWNNQC